MSVITISRGTFSGGKELASRLAQMLGYNYVTREELTDQATKMGVPVGRLQMAMVKPPRVYQRMGRERDQYLACMTMLLCEKILNENIVYQGHTGHMLLPGVPNVLRIRVLADLEYRIKAVMQQLKVDREKAKKYISDVDSDRDKWVKFLYNIDWHDPFNYDIVINLDQTGLSNASSILCSMAQLPDFQLTPAAKKAINNLLLANKAHFALMSNPKTSFADVKVTANDGLVQVTYMPQQSEVVPFVEEVLSSVSGITEIRTSIAQSSILYIQERFDPLSPAFADVVKIAKKWDAAVEMMCLASGGQCPESAQYATDQQTAQMAPNDAEKEYTGGIEDDAKPQPMTPYTIGRCLDELSNLGCSGTSSTFFGNIEVLASTLQRRMSYSMIILGELFLDKNKATQTRLKSAMKSLFSERLSVPVVEDSELHEQISLGYKQIIRLSLSLAISAVILIMVFTHQAELMNFMAGTEYKNYRALAVAFAVVIIPLFAYTFGTFMRQLLKILGLD
jgi:cytidylate kinase